MKAPDTPSAPHPPPQVAPEAAWDAVRRDIARLRSLGSSTVGGIPEAVHDGYRHRRPHAPDHLVYALGAAVSLVIDQIAAAAEHAVDVAGHGVDEHLP